MILSRLPRDADLSECSLEDALKGCSGDRRTLVVSSNILDVGRRLAFKYKLVLQLDTDLPREAWYVHADYSGVFSPGA